MLRPSLRKNDQMRPVSLEINTNKWAEGSCTIQIGDTIVICNASVEPSQPLWKRQQNLTGGWVTAEYSMLPRAVGNRKNRDAIARDHRGAEISRLIGRSFRSVVDMDKLGKHTVTIDCDVIQADGGTRCAAITGGFIALKLAVKKLMDSGRISEDPISDFLAATSVGVWHGELVLDLDFAEDSAAEMDANFVVTGDSKFIEVQATGEAHPFKPEQLSDMMTMAATGCAKLIALQKQVLS
ncbi:MAG: ribonuclease PH [Alphaproteobacteria bacterium]|nr:ribonuclease PH [Alphaproteobacteria bacterium]